MSLLLPLLLLLLLLLAVSLLHMTGGRCGCCIVILVPFVDVLHGYLNLYLLHIFGRQIAQTGLGLVVHPGARRGAAGASRQPLLLLGNGR